MNQILFCEPNNSSLINKFQIRKKYFYLTVFIFSLLLFFLLFIYVIYSRYKIYKSHSFSNKLLSQYNINTLYTFQTHQKTIQLSNDINIIGLIEIPKLNISYPILSNSNDNLLKISVCRFSRSSS